MKTEDNTVLTSVRVDKDILDTFKIECVRRKFSFTKLVTRAMSLYLENEEFRKTITNYTK